MTIGLLLGLIWLLPVHAVTGLPNDVPQELLEDAISSYIFIFKDNLETGTIRGQARQLTHNAGGQLHHVFTKALKGFSASVSAQAAARIAASPVIDYSEPEHIWPTLLISHSISLTDFPRHEACSRTGNSSAHLDWTSCGMFCLAGISSGTNPLP